MNCVERSISLWIAQTNPDSELIIYNTDVDHPVVLDRYLTSHSIYVINNNIDSKTGLPYRDVGAVRRDSLSQARGDYYICWDDDDLFMPWNNQQCLDGILKAGTWAWKPARSMSNCCNQGIRIEGNYMEASVISQMSRIREFGYVDHPGGGEHLAWYNSFERAGQLAIDETAVPAYCFNWSDADTIGGHKQSGSIDDHDNFRRHKTGCTDVHTRPLHPINILPIIEPYVDALIGTYEHDTSNAAYIQYVEGWIKKCQLYLQ